MNWIGRTLGTYQVESQIGRGAMATVYRAYQPQLARWVAVKTLNMGEGSQEFLDRFRQEARAVAALRHPNILTVYDYGEQEGVAYLVMEYVPGGALKTRLSGRPFPWLEALKLLLPIGYALAYAHEQGIVHRDIKPANILMPRDDWPLLADFGLVKLLGSQKGITRPGAILGTPAYFAPEQVTAGSVDFRSDVYSLAIMLYELLAGQPPLMGASPIETMQRRLQESIPPVSLYVPGLPTQLELILMRALERNPEARYQTMDEFVRELSWLRGDTGQAVISNTAAGPTTKATTNLRGSSLSPDAVPSPGAHLVVIGTGVTLPLPQQAEVVLGRVNVRSLQPPGIDLEPHGGGQAGVSRQHACLRQQGGRWLAEDLQSTNGTFVNERPLSPGQPVTLRHGDTIRCGRLMLVFYAQ